MSMLSPGGVVPKKRRPAKGSPTGVGRRVLGVILALLLLAGAGTAAWWFGIRANPGVKALTCPSTAPAAPASHGLPVVAPARVRLNVFNATDRKGLATTVASQLRARHFIVGKVGNDPLARTVAAPAEVRAGSRGLAAAQTVVSEVKGAVLVPDRRKDATVDVVIGATYTALRSPAQAQAALKAAARPAKPVSTGSATATPKAGCA